MAREEGAAAPAPQKTVLVGVTGCIAAYKSCEIVRLLQKAGVRAKVVMTEHATEFVGPTTFRALTREPVAVGLFDDPSDPCLLYTSEDALDAIDHKVEFIPAWAKNRIGSMVADRPDWCISRQRSWGVPIPVFKCAKCGNTVATAETFDAVIDLFYREGADAWFTHEPSDYLPRGVKCETCGCSELVPEKDILDVWWESGVSHTSVLKHREAEDVYKRQGIPCSRRPA